MLLSSDEVISQVKNAMREIYGNALDKIVLYGSRARGDYKEDSDFDFLVVVNDESLISTRQSLRVSEATFSIWEKTYIRIHCLSMASQKFYHAKTPLLYWVRKEGKEV
jgi:predicted nucleotidyltransferase